MAPPDDVSTRRPRGSGGILLLLVAVLGAVFLVQRLLASDPPVRERARVLEGIEAGWQERLVDAGDAEGFRAAADRIHRWETLREIRGKRSWRQSYRTGPTEEPPETPRGLAGSSDGAAIELRWEPAEDADAIVLLRSRRPNESAVPVVLDGTTTTFRDEILELSGAYVYSLVARRGERSSPPSPALRVAFEIEPELSVEKVDLATRTAWIRVGPRGGEPRPRLFLRQSFVVREGTLVGGQVESGFDYGTAWRLQEIAERSSEELVETPVPEFTPEGTRKRLRGHPTTKSMMFPQPVRRSAVVLAREGRAPLELEVPQSR